MIDGRHMEDRAEHSRERPASPLASTMPVSASSELNENREGFERLRSLSDRVSTIKSALEDIVNGRGLPSSSSDDAPVKIDYHARGRGSQHFGEAAKSAVHLNRHGSIDMMFRENTHS